jgi:hypothetical protein
MDRVDPNSPQARIEKDEPRAKKSNTENRSPTFAKERRLNALPKWQKSIILQDAPNTTVSSIETPCPTRTTPRTLKAEPIWKKSQTDEAPLPVSREKARRLNDEPRFVAPKMEVPYPPSLPGRMTLAITLRPDPRRTIVRTERLEASKLACAAEHEPPMRTVFRMERADPNKPESRADIAAPMRE